MPASANSEIAKPRTILLSTEAFIIIDRPIDRHRQAVAEANY
jgi:hypothetical protein